MKEGLVFSKSQKNSMKSILLAFSVTAFFFIANDATERFVPHSDSSEERVTIHYNGQKREYNTHHRIRVIQFENARGIPSTKIRLVPNDQTYTHFVLNIPGVEKGEYINGDIEFSYLDYCTEKKYKSMSVGCSNISCPINMKVDIVEYEGKGGRIKGKLVGDYLFVEEPIHFELDFDVLLH